MTRGWVVELDDGTILKEESCQWRKVPKKRIKKLSLLHDGKRWDLTNKEAYFVRNNASCVPGAPDSFRVEKRGIGYYEGSDKVLYEVDEYTGQMTVKLA